MAYPYSGCYNPCGVPPYPVYPPIPVIAAPFANNISNSVCRERGDRGERGPPGPPGRDGVSPIPVGLSAGIPAQTIPGLSPAFPLAINSSYYQAGGISVTPSTGVITFNVTGRYLVTLNTQLTSAGVLSDIILNAVTSGTILGIPAILDTSSVNIAGSTDNILATSLLITVTAIGSTLQFTINNSSNTDPISILSGDLGIQRLAII